MPATYDDRLQRLVELLQGPTWASNERRDQIDDFTKMDAFEARFRFSTMLSKLGATLTDAQKAAAYALKLKEYDEDFFSCIMEQLGTGNINNQINIMYFLEQLCDFTKEEPRYNRYIELVQRDIGEIVDKVAPLNPLGKVNIRDTKTVLGILEKKNILPADEVDALNAILDERMETELSEADLIGGKYSLSRRDCEQRMEDDRERQKRIKDLLWMTSPHGSDEFDALWESVGPVTDADVAEIKKQAKEREVWLMTMKELKSEGLKRLTTE